MADSTDSVPRDHAFASSRDTAFPPRLRDEATREREGLPQGYRMRADRHYVEQLAGHDVGYPVRMIATTNIVCEPTFDAADLRPLVESIRAHGIVHPLLVRRDDGRYEVIAGRKRFAAAQMLRLQNVPCIVHDVPPRDAAAIAAADNLSMRRNPPAAIDAAPIRQLASAHLARALRAAELSGGGADGLRRSGIELLKAHAWRAFYLMDAAEFAIDTEAPALASATPLASIVEEVVAGFRSEAQLRGIAVRTSVERPALVAIASRPLAAAIAGALLATLGLVDEAARSCRAVSRCRRRSSRRSLRATPPGGAAPIAPPSPAPRRCARSSSDMAAPSKRRRHPLAARSRSGFAALTTPRMPRLPGDVHVLAACARAQEEPGARRAVARVNRVGARDVPRELRVVSQPLAAHGAGERRRIGDASAALAPVGDPAVATGKSDGPIACRGAPFARPAIAVPTPFDVDRAWF